MFVVLLAVGTAAIIALVGWADRHHDHNRLRTGRRRELPKLFERFFRASNARHVVIPGTGLGLGIVAEIMSQHHGTIDVRLRSRRRHGICDPAPDGRIAAGRRAPSQAAAGSVEDG